MGRRKLTETELAANQSQVKDGPHAWLTYNRVPHFRDDWIHSYKETRHGGWWILNEVRSRMHRHNNTALVKSNRALNCIQSIAKTIKNGSVVLQIGSYNGFDTYNYSLPSKHITLVDLNRQLSDFNLRQVQKRLNKMENVDCSFTNLDTNMFKLQKTIEKCIQDIDYDAVCIDTTIFLDIIKIVCNKIKRIQVCCHRQEDTDTIERYLTARGYRRVAWQTDSHKRRSEAPGAKLVYDYASWEKL